MMVIMVDDRSVGLKRLCMVVYVSFVEHFDIQNQLWPIHLCVHLRRLKVFGSLNIIDIF